MNLTDRERQILALLRGNPMLTSEAIAERVGSSRAAVNVHLSNLGKKGVILGRGYLLADEPGVVVVGGANMDVKARSKAPAIAGTSNPGFATMSPGGVGRNIAENLARLGTRTHLVASVGRDPLGDTLIRETSDAGVHLDFVARTDTTTGSYTAVLDANGELVIAVSDMAATEELSPQHIDAARDVIVGSDLLVLDGNLSRETLSYARNLGASTGVRTIIEPVSVPKAAALAALPGMLDAAHPLYLVTPNRDEVTAMTGMPSGTGAELRAAADWLHENGVVLVWIRLGSRGSMLSGPDGAHIVDALPADVTDVTGAGDSLLAGFCHALLSGADPVDAVRFGHAAASLTIASSHTVRPDLTERLVDAALSQAASDTASGSASGSAPISGSARVSGPAATSVSASSSASSAEAPSGRTRRHAPAPTAQPVAQTLHLNKETIA